MKFRNQLICTLLALPFSTSAIAQKYDVPADTVKLNQEYVKVQNQITDLQSQLDIARKELPELRSKAIVAGSKAEEAANTSSEKASKVPNGDIHDAKTAKRSASNAYNKEKDARSATKRANKLDEKIKHLNKELAKKKQRLNDLDAMRAAIYAQLHPKS